MATTVRRCRSRSRALAASSSTGTTTTATARRATNNTRTQTRIGPATAKTAEEHGLRVDVLAESPSVAALTDALAAHGDALRLAALEAGESVWRPSKRRGAARRKAT